jgi:hypothetical protein
MCVSKYDWGIPELSNHFPKGNQEKDACMRLSWKVILK